MRTRRSDSEQHRPASDAIPFPPDGSCGDDESAPEPQFALAGLPESAEQVVEAIQDMSRRIDDLARELNCLGYFDDDDGPKAA